MLWILIAAFFLGGKHSIDADHIAATSNILVKTPKFSKTVKLSFFWAIGHSITAGIITIILFLIKGLILDKFLSNFEIIVAFMLIFIGIITLLWESNIFKKNKHSGSQLNGKTFGENATSSLSSKNISLYEGNNVIDSESTNFLGIKNKTNAITAIGIIQGLASNDELLLLLTFTLGLDNLYIILLCLVIFSAGVMAGMILWSSVIKLPGLKKKQERLLKSLNIVIAVIAITYGLYLLLGGEGINLIPMSVNN